MTTNRHRALIRALLILLIGAGLSVGLSLPALAAIDASIVPTLGKPGDKVVLTTGDPNNRGAYGGMAGLTGTVYLISPADLDAQARRYGHQVCGTRGDSALGSLSWKNGIGSLGFTIPNVPSGAYYFQIKVHNVSPDCWRIGTGGEPMVLTVASTVTHGTSSSSPLPAGPSPLSPWIALSALVLLGLATTLVARVTR